MSSIKAVLTDLDGTVLSADGKFSELSKLVIQKLVRQGVTVAPVTGRSYRGVREICEKLGMQDLGVFNGGAAIVDIPTGEVLWEKPIPEYFTKQLLTELVLACDYISFGQGRKATKDIVISDDVKCLSIWVEVSGSAARKIVNIVDQYTGLVVHQNKTFINGLVGLQINHSNANKQYGTSKLLDILSLKKQEILAVGDDINDVPFFEAAGYRVAMGNAPKELIELADFVTDDVNADGFARAVRKYIKNV